MVVSARAPGAGRCGRWEREPRYPADPSRQRFPAAAAATDSGPNLAAGLSHRPILSPLRLYSEDHSSFDNSKKKKKTQHTSPSYESSDIWFIWTQMSDNKISRFFVPLRDTLAGFLAP